MLERAKQALVKLALEPAWEAVFEPNSYGFRPGRSAHDAIGAIFLGIRYKPKFVFDADIKGCFDTIDHEALLKKLNSYPKLTHLIKGWLKAGVMEGVDFTPTEKGVPQACRVRLLGDSCTTIPQGKNPYGNGHASKTAGIQDDDTTK